MDISPLFLGMAEQIHNQGRVVAETQRQGQNQPPLFQRERQQAVRPPERIHIQHPPQPEPAGFLEITLNRRTENTRQIAHLAGRQIIALHKPFHTAHTAAIMKAHLWGNLYLGIKGEAIIRPPGPQMQKGANCP